MKKFVLFSILILGTIKNSGAQEQRDFSQLPSQLGKLKIKYHERDNQLGYFEIDITSEDVLWVARSIQGEVGGQPSHEREAEVVAWAMLQRAGLNTFRRKFMETARQDICLRYLSHWINESLIPQECPRYVRRHLNELNRLAERNQLTEHKKEKKLNQLQRYLHRNRFSIGTLFQLYSQPINPKWSQRNGGYCKGKINQGFCSDDRIRRRQLLRRTRYEDLTFTSRKVAAEVLLGHTPNRSIGVVDFIMRGIKKNTRIYREVVPEGVEHLEHRNAFYYYLAAGTHNWIGDEVQVIPYYNPDNVDFFDLQFTSFDDLLGIE